MVIKLFTINSLTGNMMFVQLKMKWVTIDSELIPRDTPPTARQNLPFWNIVLHFTCCCFCLWCDGTTAQRKDNIQAPVLGWECKRIRKWLLVCAIGEAVRRRDETLGCRSSSSRSSSSSYKQYTRSLAGERIIPTLTDNTQQDRQ